MVGEARHEVWPLPRFYFSVKLGDGEPVAFQEVTGLEAETQVIEYRHASSTTPGAGRVGSVTMRKGVFVNGEKFWKWHEEIKMNTVKHRTIVVTLLDETGAPKTVWTLENAWPTKISTPDLESDGNEVAVESVEIAFETLKVGSG